MTSTQSDNWWHSITRFFGVAPGATAGANTAPATIELSRAHFNGNTAELRIEAGLTTDPGCVRENNEDSIRVIRPTTPDDLERRGVLAIVCDGMGGHEGGEIASRLAVETIVKRFEEDTSDAPTMLTRAVQTANRAIFDVAERSPKLKGMGTTCTALLLRHGFAYAAHVGDSRLYLIRSAEIFLMTEDHSAVMELVRQGTITREEARHHPDKNVISRALGGHKEVQVSEWPQPFTVQSGDAFLLCSDGLYDLVDDDDLLATAHGVHPQVACDRLITLARERGGHDNISVCILAMTSARDVGAAGALVTRTVEIPQ
ncbi:MAG: Stp1/IreP family PP2C-type Ser/Thr phosphatase [Gemmatimonadaceae bacterium]